MADLRTLSKQILPSNYLPLAMEISGYLQSVWYKGERFVCPCCNGKFRKLITAGVNNRPNARCPKCNSFERHRLLWLYFKNKTNLLTEKLRVLHVCPEYFFKKTLNSLPNIEYIGAGLAAPFADVEMDITNIKEPDNSYNVILCSHVLEHIPNDDRAMRELFRVLKPGGWAILQVPLNYECEETFEDFSITSPRDREIYFGKDDHVRVYGLDYKTKLQKAGFKVKVENYLDELGHESIQRFCLPTEENIYFCTK